MPIDTSECERHARARALSLSLSLSLVWACASPRVLHKNRKRIGSEARVSRETPATYDLVLQTESNVVAEEKIGVLFLELGPDEARERRLNVGLNLERRDDFCLGHVPRERSSVAPRDRDGVSENSSYDRTQGHAGSDSARSTTGHSLLAPTCTMCCPSASAPCRLNRIPRAKCSLEKEKRAFNGTERPLV